MSINNQSGKRATSTTGSTTTKIELRILTSKTGYNFPSIFSFPPFFTKQPNQQTWAHQVRLWHQLILSYCRYHKLHKIDISSSATLEDHELFHNPSISRRLNSESILSVFESMVQSGTAEYYPMRGTKPSQSQSAGVGSVRYILIHWESPTRWAERAYEYVTENGLTNTVMTLYELTSPDHQPPDHPLLGLDPIILRMALAVLVKTGKAKLFKGSIDGVAGDGDGVKFF
ncbi:hypothetical protein Pst134EB_016407 [Puccinia striiformis f. sp. tritici]|uniref:ESCRT-II complex subunit VPS25 n=2 Tax=Puccinia striiformis f. sp. tritici TaxID=168172 RepID=A0A0L0VKL1_9BASI|nr:hypothetical protein Pst134EB_016407 [Puccinia striiformis f. sp. tritici]KNE99815.1 hypothetical protein PSTG_06903 [Puccinia striiformis f. sp. tritici PST-78]